MAWEEDLVSTAHCNFLLLDDVFVATIVISDISSWIISSFVLPSNAPVLHWHGNKKIGGDCVADVGEVVRVCDVDNGVPLEVEMCVIVVGEAVLVVDDGFAVVTPEVDVCCVTVVGEAVLVVVDVVVVVTPFVDKSWGTVGVDCVVITVEVIVVD